MLRIKKDVDLKELEKFGFYETFGDWHKECGSCYIEYWINSNRCIEIFINESDEVLDDTIYDLIKADLVEKVEGE